MLFRILFVIVFLNLAGCVTQESKSVVPDAALLTSSGETVENLINRMNQFQGTGSWQKYSVLSLTQESGLKALFETANDELKLTVNTSTGEVHSYFFIPRIVYMNKGIPAKHSHSIDPLEIMGLQGQLYLYMLEKAFPAGPREVQTTITKIINEDKEITLNFIAGGFDMKAPWTAKITASRKTEHRVEFTIDSINDPKKASDVHSIIQGVWSNEPRGEVLDDSTVLNKWTVNYLQIRTWSKGRPESSTALVGNTKSFKTVGDIRRAVKSR